LHARFLWDRLPESAEEVAMVQGPSAVVRKVSTLSLVWGVLLIGLGMVAIAEPMVAALAINILVAWLIVLAGAVHLVVAFHSREAGSIVWRCLVGLAYICFGGYLLARPAIGVASLTLLLGVLFLMEGVFDIVLFFRVRRRFARSNWILLDGIITVLLGLMIYGHWPSSSAWAIGTLVGVSMIISGVTRVMMSLAVRGAVDALRPPTSQAA
jgi:uncharacterized membrane protein HdeD (DUF308 family)